jgi:hypothetical protein
MARLTRTAYLLAAAIVVLFVTVAMVAMVAKAPATTTGPGAYPAAGSATEHDFRGARDFTTATASQPARTATPSRLGGP